MKKRYNGMNVEKAVIPAAGNGTRLAPFTKSVPKEMIPVQQKPCIHHGIDVLRESGVTEVLIIINTEKDAIIEYVESGEHLGVDVYYKVQDEQQGLGHAILRGRSWVDGDDFAVIYGDNYIRPKTVLKDVVQLHNEKNGDAALALHPVDDPTRFGIVRLDKDNKATAIIEKPSREEAQQYKTNNKFLNIAGLGVYTASIFDYIKKVAPGSNGEIRFTDAIEQLRKERNTVYGMVTRGPRYDIGTWESWEEANQSTNPTQNH